MLEVSHIADTGDVAATLTADIADLREEIRALRTEMHAELRELRTEMHQEFSLMRQDLSAMQRQIAQIGWALVGTLIAALTALVIALA